MRGYWWLSDGSGLLVERSDDSPVATWWIADPAQPELPAREHRYPAAGTANADAVNVPAMPPPSRERMRKDPPCDSCPEGLD